MKRLMGTLIVVAIVALTASAVDAGDRFSPRDRQRPGRGYHATRRARPVAMQIIATQPAAISAGDVIRSFSFEPEVVAAPVVARTTRRFANRGAERLWRRLHPGSRRR